MSDNNQPEDEAVADYSRATPEEREQVIEVLERNLKRLLKTCKPANRDKLQRLGEEYARRIRQGEIIRGKEFQVLVSLLRGRFPAGM